MGAVHSQLGPPIGVHGLVKRLFSAIYQPICMDGSGLGPQ